MGVLEQRERILFILEQAVENTFEGFVTIDQDHRVVFFNRAAERIFGVKRREVLGRDLSVIMAPGCSRDHRRAVERYVRTRIPRRMGHDTEITATRRNGETFPAAISFSAAELEGRLYFTGIVRDLTETHRLREQAQRSERLAQLGRLVAEITHEIKNPLMTIGGFARQLLQGEAEDAKRHKLEIITSEVRRLEALLGDLRTFYLPRPPDLKPLDLVALLKELLALVENSCRSQAIKVEADWQAARLMVLGDADRLKQVFLNLMQNAVQAMPEGGTLGLRTRRMEERAEVAVWDTGCGIADQEREKIFSPFHTTKEAGTGLGLSITKRILEEHPGSSIRLFSSEGRGTRFELSFELLKDDAGKSPQGEKNA